MTSSSFDHGRRKNDAPNHSAMLPTKTTEFADLLILQHFFDLCALLLSLVGSLRRRLVYRLRASAWWPKDWGFMPIPGQVALNTLKIVFAAFAPGARHKLNCKGFVYVLFVMLCPLTAFNHS